MICDGIKWQRTTSNPRALFKAHSRVLESFFDNLAEACDRLMAKSMHDRSSQMNWPIYPQRLRAKSK